MFPDGFTDALQQLLKIMSASPNSYSVEVFRYEGQQDYQAKIRLTYQAEPTEIGPK